MPVVVRDSGKMWNADDALEDVKCMIPDRCYGPFYQVFMDDCKKHGQFDVVRPPVLSALSHPRSSF
jgi:isocitrate dehydrogenase